MDLDALTTYADLLLVYCRGRMVNFRRMKTLMRQEALQWPQTSSTIYHFACHRFPPLDTDLLLEYTSAGSSIAPQKRASSLPVEAGKSIKKQSTRSSTRLWFWVRRASKRVALSPEAEWLDGAHSSQGTDHMASRYLGRMERWAQWLADLGILLEPLQLSLPIGPVFRLSAYLDGLSCDDHLHL